jgi:hypothetical protein
MSFIFPSYIQFFQRALHHPQLIPCQTGLYLYRLAAYVPQQFLKYVVGLHPRVFIKAFAKYKGLTEPFHSEFLSLQGKKQVVANAVPIPIGNYLAYLTITDFYNQSNLPMTDMVTNARSCLCPCKRTVTGKQQYATAACRKRAERERNKYK